MELLYAARLRMWYEQRPSTRPLELEVQQTLSTSAIRLDNDNPCWFTDSSIYATPRPACRTEHRLVMSWHWPLRDTDESASFLLRRFPIPEPASEPKTVIEFGAPARQPVPTRSMGMSSAVRLRRPRRVELSLFSSLDRKDAQLFFSKAARLTRFSLNGQRKSSRSMAIALADDTHNHSIGTCLNCHSSTSKRQAGVLPTFVVPLGCQTLEFSSGM
ncbi:hypothetical protein LZ31DRAFT_79627 [Colletotrichum somersetense]|nr:hypothetical protein LZ31DRAFT_79627 [Colletotrichum somersetense]